jgi:peroxin-10
VFVQTLLPYIYTKGVTEIKKQQRRGRQQVELETPTLKERLRHFVQTSLPTLQEFVVNNIRPVHLAIFYFFGAYYSFSKRLTGIRYVSVIRFGLE